MLLKVKVTPYPIIMFSVYLLAVLFLNMMFSRSTLSAPANIAPPHNLAALLVNSESDMERSPSAEMAPPS